MPQEPITSCRRKIERTSARIQVLVHCRGRFQRANIADYAQGGLQLEGTFGLIPSDPVMIELLSGVRVPGKVEWSLGGQTGIVFSEPLETSHPAMVELARKAVSCRPWAWRRLATQPSCGSSIAAPRQAAEHGAAGARGHGDFAAFRCGSERF